MKLYLFRHGIAVDLSPRSPLRDSDRPLSPDGRKKTTRAARGLVRLGVAPTHLLTSPLLRARQTAELALAAFGKPPKLEECAALAPDAPPGDLLAVLRKLPRDASVLAVGHQPHLGRFLSHVLVAGAPLDVRIGKAGVQALEFEGRGAAPLPARLVFSLTPSQLRALGGGKREAAETD